MLDICKIFGIIPSDLKVRIDVQTAYNKVCPKFKFLLNFRSFGTLLDMPLVDIMMLIFQDSSEIKLENSIENCISNNAKLFTKFEYKI